MLLAPLLTERSNICSSNVHCAFSSDIEVHKQGRNARDLNQLCSILVSIFQATDPCRPSLTVLHSLRGKQAEHKPPGPRECNDPPTTVKHILTTVQPS